MLEATVISMTWKKFHFIQNIIPSFSLQKVRSFEQLLSGKRRHTSVAFASCRFYFHNSSAKAEAGGGVVDDTVSFFFTEARIRTRTFKTDSLSLAQEHWRQSMRFLWQRFQVLIGFWWEDAKSQAGSWSHSVKVNPKLFWVPCEAVTDHISGIPGDKSLLLFLLNASQRSERTNAVNITFHSPIEAR